MHFNKSWRLIPCVLIALATIFTGCITIKTSDSAGSAAKPISEPIIAEWAMARSAIDPKLPIPDMLINQVVPEKSTWKFQRLNGTLTLRCDGNDTWYKIPLGVTVNKKTVNVNESSGKYSFSGGGSIDLSGASMVISQIMGQKIEQVSADFTDENVISLVQGNSGISAVITVNASGKYYGEMEIGGGMKWKSIQQKLTITYNGTKK
jgi:hypothetical protein